MDRFLKRVLIISLWLIVSSLDVRAQSTDPETVTFQGAVIRHALSDKSVEVSGVIEFSYFDYIDGEVYSETVEHVFTIPAGQQSIAYSETLDWLIPGLDVYKILEVTVICQINCEEASVYSERLDYGSQGVTSWNFFDSERFGLDQRDDAYIVNLKLFPSYTLIETRVELPDGQVAEEDIQFSLVSEDYAVSFGSATEVTAIVANNSFEIPSGESGVELQLKLDLLSQLFGGTREDEFFLGYQCLSASCDRAGLLREGWLGREQTNMFTDRLSAVPFELGVFDGDDDFILNVSQPIPIQLFTRDNPVNVLLTSAPNQQGAVYSGKIIVEKFYYRLFCGFGFSGPTDYSQDSRCSNPSYSSKETIVSENEISFVANEQDRVVVINVETLTNDLFCYGLIGCLTEPSFQTIKFECTEGCSNENIQTRYLSERGNFSARSVSSAKKFYQTEDFYEDDIILNLIQPPLAMPWLELLMDEEAGTDVDTTAN